LTELKLVAILEPMKRIILSIVIAITSLVATAQTNPACSTINEIVAKAKETQLATLATGTAFKTVDEMDANIASITVAGAKKCFVQDAFVGKMYVAEFEYSEGLARSAALTKLFAEKETMISKCLGIDFAENKIKTDENILGATEFHGKNKYADIKIGIYHIANPGDNKQTVYMTIIKD
jgi:hypothetical protein